MKLRSILAAIAIMACGSVFAQNATKADLAKLESQVNALSQKVTQLEANLERVITENVNLVEQLNVKTVTSVTDNNGIQWDIVKVEPNADNNDVVLTLRITNKSGVMQSFGTGFTIGKAIDSNSNLSNNNYEVMINNHNLDLQKIQPDIPLNLTVSIKNVPMTCAYLAVINMNYSGYRQTKNGVFKFSGVHILW